MMHAQHQLVDAQRQLRQLKKSVEEEAVSAALDATAVRNAAGRCACCGMGTASTVHLHTLLRLLVAPKSNRHCAKKDDAPELLRQQKTAGTTSGMIA
jgi:hypothetical protein